MEAAPLHVLIVDDEPLARVRLRSLLEAQPGVVVLGEAVDGAVALAQCAKMQPDMVLLDENLVPTRTWVGGRCVFQSGSEEIGK